MMGAPTVFYFSFESIPDLPFALAVRSRALRASRVLPSGSSGLSAHCLRNGLRS